MSFSSVIASFALSTVISDGCCIAKLFSMWPLLDELCACTTIAAGNAVAATSGIESIDTFADDVSFVSCASKLSLSSRFDEANSVCTSIGIIASGPMLLSLHGTTERRQSVKKL